MRLVNAVARGQCVDDRASCGNHCGSASPPARPCALRRCGPRTSPMGISPPPMLRDLGLVGLAHVDRAGTPRRRPSCASVPGEADLFMRPAKVIPGRRVSSRPVGSNGHGHGLDAIATPPTAILKDSPAPGAASRPSSSGRYWKKVSPRRPRRRASRAITSSGARCPGSRWHRAAG